MLKEKSYGNQNPLFLRFINRETGLNDFLSSIAGSNDPYTAEAAKKAAQNPPDLEPFRKELEDAARDLAKGGLGEEFKAFVNHYMEPSLVENTETNKGPHGESRRQVAYIKDEEAPWIQGYMCYNLCLYVKAFGLDSLKSCKTCEKLFAHKGQYARYCSDPCKPRKDKKTQV